MKFGALVKEALVFAIDNEKESERFYSVLAQRSDTEQRQNFFNQLAKEESEHRLLLLGILKQQRIPDIDDKILDLQISDYVVEAQPSFDLDHHQVLTLAIEKETASYRLYSDLAKQVDDKDLSNTFNYLAEQESMHRHRFESEYANKIFQTGLT